MDTVKVRGDLRRVIHPIDGMVGMGGGRSGKASKNRSKGVYVSCSMQGLDNKLVRYPL